MKRQLLLTLLLIAATTVTAQVGIGTTAPKSMLDIPASNAVNPTNTDGLLLPRLDKLPAINPTDDQHGMIVYLATSSGPFTPGFHYWDKDLGLTGEWVPFDSKGWKITGNDDVTSGTHFLGTTNTEEVDFRVNNKHIARITQLGQFELESDDKSIFIGLEAGESYDPASTAAEQNTVIGYYAFKESTSGRDNVAIGAFSMQSNTTGNFNTSIGDETMQSSTTGDQNSAFGNDALRYNTSGDRNTGIGHSALRDAADGNNNTGVGMNALDSTTGDNNTSVGYDAGENNQSGESNVFIGYDADATITNANNSIAIGSSSQISADNAIALGTNTRASFANAIALGNGAVNSKANQLCYGNVTEIDQAFASVVNASDGRFKYQVEEKSVGGLDFILELRPVTYKFDVEKYNSFHKVKSDLKNTNKLESGFIAQEVETAMRKTGYQFNGLVVPENKNTDNYKVSYATFVVPLVKAVQEQQKEISTLKSQMVELKNIQNEMAQLKAKLDALLKASN